MSKFVQDFRMHFACSKYLIHPGSMIATVQGYEIVKLVLKIYITTKFQINTAHPNQYCIYYTAWRGRAGSTRMLHVALGRES